jgi:hypothetical protein
MGAGTVGPVEAGVPSGLSLNPPHEIKRSFGRELFYSSTLKKEAAGSVKIMVTF